jgi:CheY-like chemotaxis protein
MMNEKHQLKYVARPELAQTKEQTIKQWKTLLLLMDFELRLRNNIKGEAAAAAPEAEKPPRAARVYLLDTDDESRRELTGVLGIGGFEVKSSLDPEEVLNNLDTSSLIIIDEDMPESQQLCSRIRERSRIPVILLGSDPGEESWKRAVAWGADAYLRRAISQREFVARIRAILRRYLKSRNALPDSDDTRRGDDNYTKDTEQGKP